MDSNSRAVHHCWKRWCYAGIAQTMGHGLTHIPEESGALIEAPADETAILTSKRFFRYQPGRVSSHVWC